MFVSQLLVLDRGCCDWEANSCSFPFPFPPHSFVNPTPAANRSFIPLCFSPRLRADSADDPNPADEVDEAAGTDDGGVLFEEDEDEDPEGRNRGDFDRTGSGGGPMRGDPCLCFEGDD